MRRPQTQPAAFRTLAGGLVAALALTLGGASAHADTITLTPTADATITDTTGNGSFDTVDSANLVDSIRQATGNVIDRSVIVFSPTLLPAGATINSVTFDFATQAVAFNPGFSSPVDILGFGSNGTITLADATTSAALLTSYDSAALGLGAHSVTLGGTASAILQAIVGSTSSFALRLQGGAEHINTQIYSKEGAALLSQPAPVLVVNFTAVPEPTSLALSGLFLGSMALVGLGRRTMKRRANDPS